jgi:hypothetical protein
MILRRWLFVLLMLASVVRTRAQTDCALPPELIVGQMGEVRVTDGEPLNVRREAGRSAEVIGTLREGARFHILSDPTCSGGIVWWQIETGALTGWIAEGVDDIYFVRPLDSALLESEAQLNAAPVFDLTQIDPQTRLYVIKGGSRQFTDSQFDSLLTLPNSTLRTWTSFTSISTLIYPSNELYVAHLADDGTVTERTLAIPAESDGKVFVDAALSPDGMQIAWLYSDCQSIFGCAPETSYALSLTDAEAENRRSVWEGAPSDVGRFSLAGWRRDSAAVFLQLSGEAPYPEPGSPVYSDPGYPPEGDVFEIPVAEAQADIGDLERRFAISPDGVWEVDRETGNGINELYIQKRDGDQRYTVPYTGYRLAKQFTFSPNNQTLVWVESNYGENSLQSSSLKVLNLQTGALTTLYEFPDSYIFEQGWLAEDLLVVQWVDLQWNIDYQLVEQVKGRLVFDVAMGDMWRLELPEDIDLLRAYATPAGEVSSESG